MPYDFFFEVFEELFKTIVVLIYSLRVTNQKFLELTAAEEVTFTYIYLHTFFVILFVNI